MQITIKYLSENDQKNIVKIEKSIIKLYTNNEYATFLLLSVIRLGLSKDR